MTARPHAPQCPEREIVLRNVTGERWRQKGTAPFCIVLASGERIYLQPHDLPRVSLVCSLLHAEWVKEQTAIPAEAFTRRAAEEAAAVEVHDYRVTA